MDWNPILLKELLPFLRQERRSYRIFWIVSILWTGLAVTMAVRTFAGLPFSRFGQVAFLVIGFVQWCLSFLAVLPAALSITLEREKNTYEGLVSSPLRAEALVRGKVFFAVYVAAVTQIAVVPLLFGTYLLGGVSLARIPLFFLLLLVHDGFLAAAGVYFSTLPQHPIRHRIGVMQTAWSPSQIAQQKAMGLWVAFVLPAIYALMALPMAAASRGAGGVPPLFSKVEDVLDATRALAAVFPVFCLFSRAGALFFTVRVPLWIPGLLLNALLAALYERLASARVLGRARDRSRGARVVFALLTHAVFGIALGNLWPQSPACAPEAIYGFLLLAVAWFLFFTVPGHTLGECLPQDREEGRAGIWRALVRPARMLLHRVSTGPAYALALAAPVPIYAALLAARCPGARAAALAGESALLLAAMIAGLGLLGLSFSVRRREGSPISAFVALLVLACLAGVVLPPFAKTLIGAGVLPSAAATALGAVAALSGIVNPFLAALDIVDRSLGASSSLAVDLAGLTGPLPLPLWMIAAGVYALLGLFGLVRLRGDWAEPPPEKDAGAPAAGG